MTEMKEEISDIKGNFNLPLNEVVRQRNLAIAQRLHNLQSKKNTHKNDEQLQMVCFIFIIY